MGSEQDGAVVLAEEARVSKPLIRFGGSMKIGASYRILLDVCTEGQSD